MNNYRPPRGRTATPSTTPLLRNADEDTTNLKPRQDSATVGTSPVLRVRTGQSTTGAGVCAPVNAAAVTGTPAQGGGTDAPPDEADSADDVPTPADGHADETGRYVPHRLPWDRFSKWRPARASLCKSAIIANNPDLADLSARVWAHLKELNEPPFLFRREGSLCRVEADDTGAPTPTRVDVKGMQYLVVELFDWRKKATRPKAGEAEEVSTRPPRDLAAHLVADPDPPVPTLNRIVTAPIFTATGQLLAKQGQYADGILYSPPRSFRFDTLPEHPDENDIRTAVKYIERSLLFNFRFAGESERANCFAALITPLVREIVHGYTPLFWIDKWKGGSGGTLLSNVIAAPHLGAPPSGVTAPRDEAEWNRLILSMLLRSPNVFFIDNCNEPLSSAALAAAITASRYEGRIIGSSNNESADVRCLWLINGNNLRFGWELARRAVRIRIDPNEPGQVFFQADLLSWVIKNRATVIYHLLVLVKAWLVRGRPGPAAGTPDFGSFESWRDVVGGILNAAEIPGFLLNLEDARQQSDQESEEIQGFIEEWRTKHGSDSVSVTDLLPVGRAFFDLPGTHSGSIRLGQMLRKYENQFHDGYRIKRLPPSRGRTQWQLQAMSVK